MPSYHLNFLLLIGVAIFGGAFGGRFFQKLRIPQVVGYIVIGIILGQSGFQLFSADTITAAEPITTFALGIIGFMIGGELHRDLFKRHGKQFIAILITEGMGAFLVVGTLSGLIVWWASGSGSTAAAFGLVLGSIASATDPAATTNVLGEFKARGLLTTAVLAIVALDDALAMTLYGIASSIAGALTGHGERGLLVTIGHPIYELFGAVLLGVAGGVILNFILRRITEHEKTLTFAIGSVFLTLGLAMTLEVDIILAAMSLGVTLINLAPKRSREAFDLVERITPPIFVLFFVFVGARLQLGAMKHWMWAVVAVFVVGQMAGKWTGAFIGARWSGAAEKVRKYLGFCLFSQAGVAIGLAILSSHRFEGEIGHAIITIITATTFLSQLIGPPLVKLGVKKAGEIGLNVTLEDLINAHTVGQVMDDAPVSILDDAHLDRVLHTFSEKEYLCYPVVDNEGRLRGLLSFTHLRKIMATEGLEEVLVAVDLMEPVTEKIDPSRPLREAVNRMRSADLNYLPVVKTDAPDKLAGFLALDHVERRLTEELLKKQKQADA